MIKLIATDLDGTFLSSTKSKPSDFREVFDEIKKRNILFAVASGRDYNGAAMYFDGYKDDIIFVCDNGANIYQGGKLLSRHTMNRQIYHALIDTLGEMGITDILVCGVKGSYIQAASSPEYLEKMTTHYTRQTVVEDLKGVDDEIFKVSVTDLTGTVLKKEVYEPLMSKAVRKELTVHMSGTRFLDIMDKTADKGVGIRELQQKYGISKGETMAFGDYYNDEPLLDSAEYAFLMDGAPEDLAAKYKYRRGSCDRDGVTKRIREWAFDKIK